MVDRHRTQSLVPDEVPVAGAMDLRTGACVTSQRRYRLAGRIAEGGMGMIYRAHDTSLSRDVALKFLKPGVPAVARQRFSREARIGASLSHPNLVPVFDRGMLPDGGEWLAMELLSGRALDDVIDQHGRLGVPLLVDIFTQTLDVLSYIHERGLVHRDLKPENLFVVRDPRCDRLTVAKLLDFGVALDLGEGGRGAQALVGDPRYMSPEQTQTHRQVDARADLYSVGLTLYEAATGRHPFADRLDGPVLGLLFAHREGGVTPPSRFLPGGLPRSIVQRLDTIVARACAVDPDARYPSAAAMRDELAVLTDPGLGRGSAANDDPAGFPRRSQTG